MQLPVVIHAGIDDGFRNGTCTPDRTLHMLEQVYGIPYRSNPILSAHGGANRMHEEVLKDSVESPSILISALF
ncbi:MAG: hypothetical protein ACLS6W_00820 [Ruminococcus sp.]